MKKSFLRVIALVLTICAMQVALVPAVSAASTSVTYDFYSRYSSYDYLYHWRTVDDDDYFDSAKELQAGITVAKTPVNDIIKNDYDARNIDWKIEYGGGYGSMATGKTSLFASTGWVDLNLGKGALPKQPIIRSYLTPLLRNQQRQILLQRLRSVRQQRTATLHRSFLHCFRSTQDRQLFLATKIFQVGVQIARKKA